MYSKLNIHTIVTECQPELSDLESLLNILNTDRELYSFVKRMRKSFVAID